jgi:hypothetical protein
MLIRGSKNASHGGGEICGLALRFDFDRPLDDPGLLSVAYDGERVVPVEVVELPTGEATFLADTSDIWASMS